MLDNVIGLPRLAVIYIVCTFIAILSFVFGIDFGLVSIVSLIVFIGGAAGFLIKIISEVAS